MMCVGIGVANLIASPLLRRSHYYLCFMKLVSSTMLTTYLDWKYTFNKVVTHMWHNFYVNVFVFVKCNHVVDEVDIDEGCVCVGVCYNRAKQKPMNDAESPITTIVGPL
jgi:hypothetical protein